MKSATLIFPHQLFKQHPAINKQHDIFLIEEWLYFSQYAFHQQKIILHRASMKFYENHLSNEGYSINYIAATEKIHDVKKLIPYLAKQGYTQINYVDVVDNWLQKRIATSCKKNGIETTVFATPNFLNTLKEVAPFFDKKKTYFQTDFYIHQRKQKNILVDAMQQPVGGKWTFDADNRQKFPKGEVVPTYPFPKENEWVHEAKKYVADNFASNYGSSKAPFVKDGFYPTTFKEAEQWLTTFLQQRFAKFGVYEDALVAKENILYHSVLTPMLNIGLLTPQQIIDAVLPAAASNNIPLNSVEGFIRQIIGWREFIRIVYERDGSHQRTKNYWGFTRKIPESFYTGTTGIKPIDNTIKKLLTTGYNHHIERLMVMGNFMLLCEFDPNEVYKWFMEMYIDSYDWVMVPNVYGMTQFADGGLMTTKPYISGSNYILKMSDYKKTSLSFGEGVGVRLSWCEIWDGLFWRFMHVHRDFFLKNPRLGMLVHTFDKMSADKRNHHLQIAENYLAQLDKK
jgi:deoxyribodipyrimidine photolyase-related protein